jgi:LysM repeat protein
VVQPGDTLAGIARCRATSIEALARANAIYDRDRIEVGWRLRVPPGDFCERVAEGGPGSSASAAAAAGRVHSTTAAKRMLTTARALYDDGDFEASLRAAEQMARTLSEQRTNAARSLRARGHLIAGMSAAGLGDRARAIGEFRSARALDPSVSLGDEDASPRLVELFRAAASASGPHVLSDL